MADRSLVADIAVAEVDRLDPDCSSTGSSFEEVVEDTVEIGKAEREAEAGTVGKTAIVNRDGPAEWPEQDEMICVVEIERNCRRRD